jgi:hypothetical protein
LGCHGAFLRRRTPAAVPGPEWTGCPSDHHGEDLQHRRFLGTVLVPDEQDDYQD